MERRSAHLKTVNPATGKPFGSIVVMPAGEWAYATLALGSALALFVYPHATTGVFAAKRRDVIRRNAAMLPAYSLILGLIALFGYMARAVPAVNADVKAAGGNPQLSVPLLFAHIFPSWFAGIGYSAIVIGALVPAAIMSIAAANLFTRTIYKELLKPDATPAQETRVARLASLIMKVGALGFALELNKTFSINLQLLGGIWILQTFPAIVISLYTRWFHRSALIFGWAVGMAYGTIQAYRMPGGGQAHFGTSAAPGCSGTSPTSGSPLSSSTRPSQPCSPWSSARSECRTDMTRPGRGTTPLTPCRFPPPQPGPGPAALTPAGLPAPHPDLPPHPGLPSGLGLSPRPNRPPGRLRRTGHGDLRAPGEHMEPIGNRKRRTERRTKGAARDRACGPTQGCNSGRRNGSESESTGLKGWRRAQVSVSNRNVYGPKGSPCIQLTTYPEAHDPRCHSTQTGCPHAIPARATAHAGPGHRSLCYLRRHDRHGHGGHHAVGFGHAVEYRRVPHPSAVQ